MEEVNSQLTSMEQVIQDKDKKRFIELLPNFASQIFDFLDNPPPSSIEQNTTILNIFSTLKHIYDNSFITKSDPDFGLEQFQEFLSQICIKASHIDIKMEVFDEIWKSLSDIITAFFSKDDISALIQPISAIFFSKDPTTNDSETTYHIEERLKNIIKITASVSQDIYDVWWAVLYLAILPNFFSYSIITPEPPQEKYKASTNSAIITDICSFIDRPQFRDNYKDPNQGLAFLNLLSSPYIVPEFSEKLLNNYVGKLKTQLQIKQKSDITMLIEVFAEKNQTALVILIQMISLLIFKQEDPDIVLGELKILRNCWRKLLSGINLDPGLIKNIIISIIAKVNDYFSNQPDSESEIYQKKPKINFTAAVYFALIYDLKFMETQISVPIDNGEFEKDDGLALLNFVYFLAITFGPSFIGFTLDSVNTYSHIVLKQHSINLNSKFTPLNNIDLTLFFTNQKEFGSLLKSTLGTKYSETGDFEIFASLFITVKYTMIDTVNFINSFFFGFDTIEYTVEEAVKFVKSFFQSLKMLISPGLFNKALYFFFENLSILNYLYKPPISSHPRFVLESFLVYLIELFQGENDFPMDTLELLFSFAYPNSKLPDEIVNSIFESLKEAKPQVFIKVSVLFLMHFFKQGIPLLPKVSKAIKDHGRSSLTFDQMAYFMTCLQATGQPYKFEFPSKEYSKGFPLFFTLTVQSLLQNKEDKYSFNLLYDSLDSITQHMADALSLLYTEIKSDLLKYEELFKRLGHRNLITAKTLSCEYSMLKNKVLSEDYFTGSLVRLPSLFSPISISLIDQFKDCVVFSFRKNSIFNTFNNYLRTRDPYSEHQYVIEPIETKPKQRPKVVFEFNPKEIKQKQIFKPRYTPENPNITRDEVLQVKDEQGYQAAEKPPASWQHQLDPKVRSFLACFFNLFSDLKLLPNEQIVPLFGIPPTQSLKIGILYVKANQYDQKDIFSNTHDGVSSRFHSFLEGIGCFVYLPEHRLYRGKLEANNPTSQFSIYFGSSYHETMFHVNTLLPDKTDDPQRLAKKRHIGNDNVHIIWCENEKGYDQYTITSQFNDAHVVVYPMEDDLFRVQVLTKKESTQVCPLPREAVIRKEALCMLVRWTAIVCDRNVRNDRNPVELFNEHLKGALGET